MDDFRGSLGLVVALPRGRQRRRCLGIQDTNGTQQTNGTVQLMFPPATTPFFLDYDDFHPRSGPSGKNVVYMDGHVTALEVPDLAE
jgi:prepilin-type processing-associated H-X9-DG protein